MPRLFWNIKRRRRRRKKESYRGDLRLQTQPVSLRPPFLPSFLFIQVFFCFASSEMHILSFFDNFSSCRGGPKMKRTEFQKRKEKRKM